MPEASPNKRGIKLHDPQFCKLEHLKDRYGAAPTLAMVGLLAGTATVGVLALAAHLAHSPLVFPSLGPTTFLLFYKPLEAPASPRNTIWGHLIGACAGWVSLLVFGLAGMPAAGLGHVGLARVGATALSIGLTNGLMALCDVPHPPAGATTMIVSLGLMPELWQLGVLMFSVMVLVLLGWAVNHVMGVPYPSWRGGLTTLPGSNVISADKE